MEKDMKIELKHLAPYLPYGLKVMYTHGGKIGEIKSLLDISEYDDIKIRMDYQDGEHIWMFKPILRPMSDLPERDNYNLFMENKLDELTREDFNKLWKMVNYIFTSPLNAPYWFVDMLFKNHFDVFGLIPAGLAIDINTIDKKTP